MSDERVNRLDALILVSKPATISISLACLLSFSWMFAGCDSDGRAIRSVDRDQITQFSIINALLLGHYTGVATMHELLRYGDFGIGTFDHLDGELIALDGTVYQVLATGVVCKASPASTTPFATVTHFEADGELPCSTVTTLSALDAHLDNTLTAKSAFFAIRVDGFFSSITLRSVPRQEPPYEPLVEVAKKQSIWTHENVRGTMLGIRSPKWTDKLSVPGYHWHFISDDRRVGGHVIDCHVDSGTIIYDRCTSWLIKLSESEEFQSTDLGQDLGRELEQVEKKRRE